MKKRRDGNNKFSLKEMKIRKGDLSRKPLVSIRKAQITVFIILALVILASVGGYFAVKNFVNEVPFEGLSFDDKTEVVTESLNDCFNTAYEDSLDYIGLQGGYSGEPLSVYLDTGYDVIPFYYFGELTTIPSIDFIEEELEYDIESRNLGCLDLISKFDIDSDFNYKSTNVTIEDGNIIFLVDLDLTLIKGTETSQIDFKDFPIEVKSNIKEMNSFSSYIAYSHEINDEAICISCFIEIAEDKELKLEFIDDYETILLVNVLDTRFNYFPSVYSFLMTNIPLDNEDVMVPESSELETSGEIKEEVEELPLPPI